jgi:hypothetical protein
MRHFGTFYKLSQFTGKAHEIIAYQPLPAYCEACIFVLIGLLQCLSLYNYCSKVKVAATPRIRVAGFKSSLICPFNSNVLQENEFSSSLFWTDRHSAASTVTKKHDQEVTIGGCTPAKEDAVSCSTSTGRYIREMLSSPKSYGKPTLLGDPSVSKKL